MFVAVDDICLVLPYRPDVFRKFLLVAGGIPAISKRIPSLKTGHSVKGYPLDAVCTFLRQHVPLFDSEAEQGLTRLARPGLL